MFISLSSSFVSYACAIKQSIINYNIQSETLFFDWLVCSLKSVNEVIEGKEISLDKNSIVYPNNLKTTSITFKNFDLLISHHDINEPNEQNILDTTEKYKRRYIRFIETIKNQKIIFFIRYCKNINNIEEEQINIFYKNISNINNKLVFKFILVSDDNNFILPYSLLHIENFIYINLNKYVDDDVINENNEYFKKIKNYKCIFDVIKNKEYTEDKNNYKQILIERIKNTGCFKSNKELYGDRNKKICFLWSPRGGCSITFKCFLDMIGLLDDAEKYSNWIHNYRMEIMWPNISYISIPDLKKNNYHIIKIIVNPYSRAVSIWRVQTCHNLSFRDYLKELIYNKISYFDENHKYHLKPQYIDEEEKIVTKYIKLDKYEKYDILLPDGTNYNVDVTKYTSQHHAKRRDHINYFVGDIKLNDIRNIVPKSYKYFYDDEIKEMVYTYYKKDIENYGYSFEEMI